MMKPQERKTAAELKALSGDYFAVNRKYIVYFNGSVYWAEVTGDGIEKPTHTERPFTSEQAATEYAVQWAKSEPAAMLHYSDLIIY